MKLSTIIWKELWLRKSQLVSALLGITLGISVIVGIQSVSAVSEKAVKVSLDNLGANILVLPQAASVDDYYSADIDAPTFPEDYVERLATSMLPGVDNLSPKLTRRISINGVSVILTGILPASELASKPIWQTAGLVGAGLNPACDPNSKSNQSFGYVDEKLQRKAVDSLRTTEILAGSVIAQRLNVREGGTLAEFTPICTLSNSYWEPENRSAPLKSWGVARPSPTDFSASSEIFFPIRASRQSARS
jgi:ABC-type lipoprotein release transport system permease subunit